MFFLVTRIVKIYSLCNFQIHNMVLLTIITLLYRTSQDLTYGITGSLYLLTLSSISPSLPPTSGNHPSVLCVDEFGFVFFQIPHMRLYGICLSLSDLFHLA